MKATYVMILVLLALPLCYADVGPAPNPPTVIVRLVSNGIPAAGVSEITYHCMGSDVSDPASAVEPYMTIWSCSAGTCTNEGSYYYKFNPCFDFPGGHFSYEFDGKTVRSEDVKFNSEFTTYDITIDAASGQVKSKVGSNMPTGCLPAMVLPAFLGAVFLLSRK